MKAPEEYLENFVIDNGDPYYTEGEVMGMLKAMQEDHEKELIEAKQLLVECRDTIHFLHAQHGKRTASGDYMLTKIAQFRNKQQDK